MMSSAIFPIERRHTAGAEVQVLDSELLPACAIAKDRVVRALAEREPSSPTTPDPPPLPTRLHLPGAPARFRKTRTTSSSRGIERPPTPRRSSPHSASPGPPVLPRTASSRSGCCRFDPRRSRSSVRPGRRCPGSRRRARASGGGGRLPRCRRRRASSPRRPTRRRRSGARPVTSEAFPPGPRSSLAGRDWSRRRRRPRCC